MTFRVNDTDWAASTKLHPNLSTENFILFFTQAERRVRQIQKRCVAPRETWGWHQKVFPKREHTPSPAGIVAI